MHLPLRYLPCPTHALPPSPSTLYPAPSPLTPPTRIRHPSTPPPRFLAALLEQLTTTKTALIVPAFEVSSSHRLPRRQNELAALTRTSPPAATPFHCAHFPSGHLPTDFPRWFHSSEPYPVPYEECFEPYIIASRSWLPPFDERFAGYGHNKIAHAYAAASAGAIFLVLPHAFVAAHEHHKSNAWQNTFGKGADPIHRMRGEPRAHPATNHFQCCNTLFSHTFPPIQSPPL